MVAVAAGAWSRDWPARALAIAAWARRGLGVRGSGAGVPWPCRGVCWRCFRQGLGGSQLLDAFTEEIAAGDKFAIGGREAKEGGIKSLEDGLGSGVTAGRVSDFCAAAMRS